MKIDKTDAFRDIEEIISTPKAAAIIAIEFQVRLNL